MPCRRHDAPSDSSGWTVQELGAARRTNRRSGPCGTSTVSRRLASTPHATGLVGGGGVNVDQRTGAIVSVALAPLVDGPRQELGVAHATRSVWQLVDPRGHVVACVTFQAGLRLPHAISVTQPPRTASLVVGGGTLSLEGRRLPVMRWWRPARPRHPSLGGSVRDDVAAGFARRWRQSLGHGEGLTPYADDVLCGTLATLHAARHPVADTVSREIEAAPLEDLTTAASAGLLRQTAAGWCLDEVAAVLAARVTGVGLPQAAAALHRIGHSSGRGLSEGIDRVLGAATRKATT